MDTSAFEHRIARFIEERDLLPPGASVLVGVSGGADSVVLLHLLDRLGYAVTAAHVNYGLRGRSADEDEAHVRRLCADRGIPLHVTRFDTARYARAQGQSVQEAARELRYRFFRERAEAAPLSHVAVAHHLDDQAETVLLNLFRGTGPEGLAGMPARRVLARGREEGGRIYLIRPLLSVRRQEVEAYAGAAAIPWRTDVSNASPKYRRTVIRHQLLPLVDAHYGPSAAENIARAADLMQDYLRRSFRPRLSALFREAACPHAAGGLLDASVLRAQAPVWRRRLILEALRRWMPGAPRTAAAVRAVERLLEAQPGRRLTLGQGTVWREREGLLFLPPQNAPKERDSGLPAALQPGERLTLTEGSLSLELPEERPARLDAGAPNTVFLDADRLAFPLTIRHWQAGDRLQPLGMRHGKNVSDLLTDARVPSYRRGRALVVASADEIVWVVGVRLAHPFRVRPETRHIAKITYYPPETTGAADGTPTEFR